MKHTEEMQKITIHLPTSLIDPLMADLNMGKTEVIKEALQELKRKCAYEKLASLRGKIDFGMTWQEMKEDRE